MTPAIEPKVPAQTSAPDAATLVGLSARAAKRINAILASEQQGAMLRISVNGGGCSGFQYAFEITTEKLDDDLEVSRDGATLLIDAVSLDYVRGSEVDFVDDLIGQSFKIHNPNAIASCGCGTSFSI
eukprot:gene6363-6430_t